MSQSSGDLLDRRQFDIAVAFIGLITAVAAIPLRLVVSHLYAQVLPPAIAVACLLYLIAARRDRSEYSLATLSTPVVRILPSLTLIAVSGLVVLVTVDGARTVRFLLLAGAIGSLILLQLLFVREEDLRPLLVLGQILALSFVVRFAGLSTTAGVIGIDTWTHIELIEAVRTTEDLQAMLEFPSRGAKYYTAPLYHLLVLVTVVVGDIPSRLALFLSLGTALAMAPVLVYVTARLFVDVRWSLVAGLLYAVSDQAVRWSLNLIPTSMALLLFLGAVYLLVRVITLRKLRDIVLLTVLMVALPLTHQVGAFVMVVLLLSAFFVQLILFLDFPYRAPAANDLTGVLLFQVGVITFVWSLTPYRGGRFLSVITAQLVERVRTGFGLFTLRDTPAAEAASAAASGPGGLLSVLIAYIDVFGFVFMLAIATLGSLYVLDSRRASHVTLAFVLSTVVMALFALVIPLFGIDMFLPGRWFAFMYALMVVLGVVGLAYLTTNLGSRTVVVGMLIVLLAVPTTMLVASDATRDNPVFPDRQLRFGYSQAEVDGMETIGTIVSEENPVWTDSPYASIFRRRGSHLAVQGTIGPDNQIAEERVVYRDYQTTGAPLFVHNGTVVLQSIPYQSACGSRDILYDNGEVSYCVRPPS